MIKKSTSKIDETGSELGEATAANHVLIIDDDHELRELICEILENEGYKTVGASDGEKGLSIFETGRFDIVICDINMPNMDGIETILNLRRATTNLGIIAISGGGAVISGDYLEAAKKLGADVILRKPLSPTQLIACLAGFQEKSAKAQMD